MTHRPTELATDLATKLLSRALAEGPAPQTYADTHASLHADERLLALIDVVFRVGLPEHPASAALEAELRRDPDPAHPVIVWPTERIAAVFGRVGVKPNKAFSAGWLGTAGAYLVELAFATLAPWPGEVVALRDRVQLHMDGAIHAGRVRVIYPEGVEGYPHDR